MKYVLHLNTMDSGLLFIAFNSLKHSVDVFAMSVHNRYALQLHGSGQTPIIWTPLLMAHRYQRGYLFFVQMPVLNTRLYK